MDREKIYCVVSICLLVSGSLGLGYLIADMRRSEMDNPQIEFVRIAENIASLNEYDVDSYNCVNFSSDLVAELINKGYDAKVVTGWKADKRYCKVGEGEYIKGIPLSTVQDKDCLGAHAWVEVTIPIEAVSGRVINRWEI